MRNLKLWKFLIGTRIGELEPPEKTKQQTSNFWTANKKIVQRIWTGLELFCGFYPKRKLKKNSGKLRNSAPKSKKENFELLLTKRNSLNNKSTQKCSKIEWKISRLNIYEILIKMKIEKKNVFEIWKCFVKFLVNSNDRLTVQNCKLRLRFFRSSDRCL